MNKLILAVSLTLIAPLANAQVTSTSSTQVQTGSSAGAVNSGVTNSNVFEGTDHMRYDYGHQRVEQVAPLALGGAAAGFSNENCANTTQGGLSTMWFSAAKGNATESIRCNARRDAGVYVALADDAKANGLPEQAAKLRAMAWYQKCTATQQEISACQRLVLIGNDGNPVVADSYRANIPKRPEGTYWQDGRQVDMRGVPVDSGSNVRHNP
jgi:hypothetical protein